MIDDETQEEFEEIEMGELEEDIRPYMVIDKDTGKSYDIRKDEQVRKALSSVSEVPEIRTHSIFLETPEDLQPVKKSFKSSPQEFFAFAVEHGDISTLMEVVASQQ